MVNGYIAEIFGGWLSIVKTFPYALSTSKDLEYLDLTGTRIRAKISNDIVGFKNLLYLDITDTKVNFKGIKFLDKNKSLFIIRKSDVYPVHD